MKFGVRKPSIKKSISARTTGKVKRKLKRVVNPFYGKSGVGLVTDPKKSVYNKVYRKTTVSAKQSMGCLASCIYYPIYFSCLIMWWALKYSVLFLLWAGTLLINGFISIVEFIMNLNSDASIEDDHIENPILIQQTNSIEVASVHINPKDTETRNKEGISDIKPMAYYETLQREIQPLEDVMVGFAVALKEVKPIDDRIKLLTSLIDTYYDIKGKCAELGAEYTEYFSNSWEHCRNSRNPDFNYVERFEVELQDLQNRYTELKAREELYEKESKDLKERVIATIESNPGILQTDVYKQFDPIVKSDISHILYQLSQDELIERVKSGRTYQITIVK